MAIKQTWQNRIVGHAEVDPNELKSNPLNWRLHSDAQRKAMRGVLNEVGWVQEVIVNKQTGVLVDGHLRLALAIERKETRIPVKYVNLDANEEALILATLDPIGAMATTDAKTLDSLLRQVSTGEDGVQKMLSGLADVNGLYNQVQKSNPNPASPDQVLPLSFDGLDSSSEQEVQSDTVQPDLGATNASHVKMIQVFLNTETYPEFMRMLSELAGFLGTKNQTDTITEAVRYAYNSIDV